MSGSFRISFDGAFTDHLKFDITADDMVVELEGIVGIQDVEVQRSGIISNGYEWTVTFSTQPGNIPHDFSVNITGFRGTNPASAVTTVTGGTNYGSYMSAEVGDLDNGPPYTHTIDSLMAGTAISVRVSPFNEVGYGRAMTSLPVMLAPAKQKPDIPLQVQLAVGSSTSLRVLWNKPDSDGGDTIIQYKVEWDLKSSFDSGDGGLAKGSDTIAVSANACDPLP